MNGLRLEALTSHIFLLYGKNNGSFPYSHSILILDEDKALIDTGCGIEILEQLKRKYNVGYVINSHTHPDHSAGNWVFDSKPIYVPEEGFKTSGDIVALSKRFVGKKLARTWQYFVKESMCFKNCKPTHIYNERTKFDFGDVILEPIYTPGHTRDHYCFFEKKGEILFSFDYDLTSFPWYGHEESSLSEFKKSINKLMEIAPKIVVSSHRGLITKNLRREFEDYCKVIDDRSEKILSLLEGGRKTLDQLISYAPIYGKFPYAEKLLRYWEKQMVKKHLKQLEIECKIKKLGGFYIKV